MIREIAQLRAKKAALFGYSNWADYTLYDQMAKNRETAIGFLDRLAPAVAAKQRQEAADIRALAKSQGAASTPTAADWNFYAEQIRKQRYAIDSDQLKQYFEFNKVLEDGVFYAANQLYGLTFKERKDIPTWSPDMRVFDVIDADGKPLAIFMIDPWKRDNKNGGAWMSNLVNQSYLRGTKPVVFNVENFTKPAPGQPALISWDDVTTMFHEFGHALHGMFASQTYPTISGTNVARDFVEFPSQFNENWALDPKILPHYAVHYKTGQTIPQDLIQKVLAARTFNQGYEVGEVLEAARLDLDWHSLPATAACRTSTGSRRIRWRSSGYDTADVPSRYRSSYFLHIWSNGYSAGYYAYPWTRMLGQDAFAWFQQQRRADPGQRPALPRDGPVARQHGRLCRDVPRVRRSRPEHPALYRLLRAAERLGPAAAPTPAPPPAPVEPDRARPVGR